MAVNYKNANLAKHLIFFVFFSFVDFVETALLGYKH